jgi:glycosyltransferase involved in cell wall biosynthesis
MNPNRPFISICIPSYNRANKLKQLVDSLLRYEGNDIEVVVLDNCSSDETPIIMNNIHDVRFRFIENESNIGGPLNHIKVLTHALGKYAFLCLDKDFLDIQKLQDLISNLKNEFDVVFGYCSLNLEGPISDVVHDKGFSSVFNMAYLSQHPSGMFFRVNELKKINIVNVILNSGEKFPFNPDLLCGEMAMEGKGKIIGIPIFFTESKQEASLIRSHTYNSDNLFFSPKKRLEEMQKYLSNAVKLNLSKFEILQLSQRIYSRSLISATIGYKNLLVDQNVCDHHNICTRKVKLKEIWDTDNLFSSSFIDTNLPLTFLSKMRIIILVRMKIFLKIFL